MLRQEAECVCWQETGCRVLCSTKPVVPAIWKLSALWSHCPCVGLKHFPVAGECGNAGQAALEADKTLFAFGILSGREMWLNCFYILSANMCCGAEKAFGNWYH